MSREAATVQPHAAAYFRRFAKSILQDIEMLVEDAQFIKDGGRILTAADFSEIFAYCMSASDSFLTTHLDLGETNDQRSVISTLHEAVMLYYMFEVAEPLWLLYPYAIELNNFLRTVSSQRFKRTLQHLGGTLRDQRLLQNDPEFAEVRKSVNEIPHNTPFPDPLRRRAFELVQKVAPQLLAFDKYSDTLNQPEVRLKRLLSEGRLILPSDLQSEVADGTPDVKARWRAALDERRPEREAHNESDAEAISILHAANGWLINRMTAQKLVLLCRSETMHHIMETEVAQGLWNDVGGNVLRHPRGLLALLDEDAQIVRNRDADRQLLTLERWKRTFNPIAHANPPANRAAGSLNDVEIFRRHSALIRDSWQRYCGINAAIRVVHRVRDDPNDELRSIRAAFEDDGIKRMVREQLDELNFTLARSSLVLSALESPEMRKSRRPVIDGAIPVLHTPAPERAHAGEPRFIHIYNAHGAPLSFRICLQDVRLSNVLLEDRRDPWRIISVLTQSNMVEQRHAKEQRQLAELEWFLAMGYVCSAIGAWKAAKQACEIARHGLQLPASLELGLLEAKATREIERLEDPQSGVLTQWLQQQLKRADLSPVERLRLQAEALKHECLQAQVALDRFEPDTQIETLLAARSSLSIARTDLNALTPTVEACDLANSVLYHWAVLEMLSSTVDGWQLSLYDLGQLDSFVREVYGESRLGWPDNYVDSYYWVKANLIQRQSFTFSSANDEAEAKREIIEELARISSHTFSSSTDITDFRSHARLVRKLLY